MAIFDSTIAGLVSIIFGALVIIFPSFLRYLVGGYLIILGILFLLL